MAEPVSLYRDRASLVDGVSTARRAFPQTPDDFETDARVSWSKLEKKWILEDDDGSEWDYNESVQKWVPSLDEAALERQSQAYAVEGVDEDAPAQPSKKRKTSTGEEQTNDTVSQKKKPRANKQSKEPPRNTAVYVTSLPLDVTVDEVAQTFSRCGVIAEEIDSGKPRIKLYTDDDGKFKGDALIVFFRPESISIAIQLLHEADFRLGEEGPAGKMQVTEADRSYKKQQDRPQGGDDKGDKKQPARSKDQKKIIKKTQKLNDKLTDWSDDDVSALPETSSRFDKVVILKHMFTQQEIKEDPAAILDIKEDIRDECSKLGDVTNVQLFDKEIDGVVSVRFTTTEAANSCVRMMGGRMFAGQAVKAYISTGEERFKKSSAKKTTLLDDSESEEDERMDNFGKYLEGNGNGNPPQ